MALLSEVGSSTNPPWSRGLLHPRPVAPLDSPDSEADAPGVSPTASSKLAGVPEAFLATAAAAAPPGHANPGATVAAAGGLLGWLTPYKFKKQLTGRAHDV